MESYKILRTDASHPDFVQLVHLLDEDLAMKNGEKNSFFAQFNNIEFIQNVIVVYKDNKAIGCGAFKPYDEDTVEIKRMYVHTTARNKGVGHLILGALQLWAKEVGFSHCILETGSKMKAAIQLYLKDNFIIIPNYGPYVEIEDSICFKKAL